LMFAGAMGLLPDSISFISPTTASLRGVGTLRSRARAQIYPFRKSTSVGRPLSLTVSRGERVRVRVKTRITVRAKANPLSPAGRPTHSRHSVPVPRIMSATVQRYRCAFKSRLRGGRGTCAANSPPGKRSMIRPCYAHFRSRFQAFPEAASNSLPVAPYSGMVP